MPSPFQQIAAQGLKQWGGFISDEFLRDLQGPRGMLKLREMSDNDDIIGGCLFAIEQFAGQVDWSIEPPESSTEGPAGPSRRQPPQRGTQAPPVPAGPSGAVERPEPPPRVAKPALDERGEFLRSALFDDMDRPWRETLKDCLTMLTYGFAPMEIVYKRRVPRGGDPALSSRYDDGLIGWDRWFCVAQETVYRWLFDEQGRVLGLEQKTDTAEAVTIPSEKLLLFRASQRRGNPEGRSILRTAYVDWFVKKRIREVEGIGIERDLAGMPVITAPENTDWWNANDPNAATTLAYMERMVTSIRADEQGGLILPFGTTFQLAGSAGAKKTDTNAIVTRYDQRIAMTMLADFILIGHEQVGSMALTTTKLEAFQMAMTAFLDHIEDMVNRVAVPRLWKLNGWPIENLPRLKHGPVESVDLTALGTFLKDASAAGVTWFPNTNLEEHLHNVAKFPAPPEGFEARAEFVEQTEQANLEAEAARADAEFELQREALAAKAPPAPPKGAPPRRKADQ
jgi:hypothetical protein